ncbi:protein of unknown function [Halogranum amylolyticum]|uniref:DUF4177 domain-containing protein n=1 Tax=Halogranum amylolyticum TaxID=660520 RepID=A0A1H8SRV3_9EURY|nr:DUF4177 domain-containing protein [Halogranum amylolyticum]SEO81317.1 protein of unknown function [Halogranum amylolyticum]
MPQWEYKIVSLERGGLFGASEGVSEELLNRLGEDDWELAASLTGSETGLGGRPKSRTSALVFKRPKE